MAAAEGGGSAESGSPRSRHPPPPSDELLLPASDDEAAGESARPAERASEPAGLPGAAAAAADGSGSESGSESDEGAGDNSTTFIKSKSWRRASMLMGTTSAHRSTTLAPEVWREFDRLDVNKDGVLDMGELGNLTNRLGVKLTKKQIKAARPELDPDNTGKVTLGRLDHWFYHLKMKQRVVMRREAKALFDSYSANPQTVGGNVIEKHAFEEMMTAHGESFNCASFDPETEWPKLDEYGRVTFTNFEQWWKKRLGVSTHNTDVLPEYLRQRLDEEGYARRKQEATLWAGLGAQHDARSGHALWDSLRLKLRSINRMTDVWGPLDEVYETNESSAYGQPPLGAYIIDPEGFFAQIWDLFGVLMLMYVIVTVPLTVAFGVETDLWSGWFLVDLVVDVFFITDVVLNFRTAFMTKSGHREGRPLEIARHYCKNWFFIDLVSCLPVQYISYMVEGETDSGAGNVKMLKSLRLMRLAKMLRIARLRKFFQKYADDVKTAQWLPAISMLFIILFLCHMLSCAWYLAGDTIQTLSNDKLIAGWVIQEPDWYRGEEHLDPTCVNDDVCRHQLEAQVQNISLTTRYSTSMYYVFNALERGFTDSEKVLAVISELTLGLIYGMLAGLMSSLLIVMGSGEAELQTKVVQLRQWMNSHRMPKPFQHQALEYFHRVWETKLPLELEQEMTLALPPAMDNFMKQHMYSTALKNVPLFRSLGEEIFAELCQRVNPQLCLNGQYVMQCGDIGTHCYVLLSGELRISEPADPAAPEAPERFLGYLSEGAFFGEVPLLSNYQAGSEVRKRTVQSVTESRLCYITRGTITDMRSRFPELEARLRRFAVVGTTAGKAMKTLKKHNLGEDEIKRLQEQTQHNVNVQREGVLNKIKPGAGHRLTRYAYKLISDWSDADPTLHAGDHVRICKSGAHTDGETAVVLDPSWASDRVKVTMDSDGTTKSYLESELQRIAESDEAENNAAAAAAAGGATGGDGGASPPPPKVPAPPTTANPSSRRGRPDALELKRTLSQNFSVPVKDTGGGGGGGGRTDGEQMSEAKVASLVRRVTAIAGDNDEASSMRKTSIWIKYEQGFRAGKWREVFPYLQDIKDAAGAQHFNALETLAYEHFTATGKLTGTNSNASGVGGASVTGASRTLHVGGLEGHTDSGMINIEDERAIAAAFSRFGHVMAVSFRSRREVDPETGTEKVSWALVSFQTPLGPQAAMEAVRQEDETLLALSKQPLRLKSLDLEQAMASRGSMRDIARDHTKKIREEEARVMALLASGDGTGPERWLLQPPEVATIAYETPRPSTQQQDRGPSSLSASVSSFDSSSAKRGQSISFSENDRGATDAAAGSGGGGGGGGGDTAAVAQLAAKVAEMSRRVEANERTAAEHRSRVEAALDILLQAHATAAQAPPRRPEQLQAARSREEEEEEQIQNMGVLELLAEAEATPKPRPQSSRPGPKPPTMG